MSVFFALFMLFCFSGTVIAQAPLQDTECRYCLTSKSSRYAGLGKFDSYLKRQESAEQTRKKNLNLLGRILGAGNFLENKQWILSYDFNKKLKLRDNKLLFRFFDNKVGGALKLSPSKIQLKLQTKENQAIKLDAKRRKIFIRFQIDF